MNTPIIRSRDRFATKRIADIVWRYALCCMCFCGLAATAFGAKAVAKRAKATPPKSRVAAPKVRPAARRAASRNKAPATRPKPTVPKARPIAARKPTTKRPTLSPRQQLIRRVEKQLVAFVSIRKKQADHSPPKPFPATEQLRWAQLLHAIESHMGKLPLQLLKRLRRTLEHESDRDRNRFRGLPGPLSNRIIKCMVALSLRMGLFKRPKPVRVVRKRPPARRKMRSVPNPSELPPLVFTQKDLDRFKPPTTKLGWPIKGGRIGSGFGWRRDPFTRKRSFHGAVDIGAAFGSPVYAAEGGLVIRTGWMGKCGMGVVLQHSPTLRTYYCHLSQILAPINRTVKRGQRIGSVGSTGRSTSPHLHFVVSLNGRAVNPADYLK